ncbi:MAG: hypothetical protein KBD78_15490, partial [Oligoflexales bacterium]|nr:hypothetical protein [Oligoflexales bacterium]
MIIPITAHGLRKRSAIYKRKFRINLIIIAKLPPKQRIIDIAKVTKICYNNKNMAKRPFIRKQKRKQHGTTFWDSEYTNASHLKLSTEASEDLEKFTRWLARQNDTA